MDITETLKHTAIELHNEIVKLLKTDTPQVIINQFYEAFNHITSAVTILDKSDE